MTSYGLDRPRAGATPIVRSVSSVTFGIGGAEPFERAVKAAGAWLRKRNPAVPADVGEGRPFDVGGNGAPVARAVTLDFEEGRIWSSASDLPDPNVAGRTWITEITIAERSGEVHFGTRLLNATRGVDAPFIPSVPRVVRDIIHELPCRFDGQLLSDELRIIATVDDLDDLCELLEHSGRRLPVIVLAEGVSRQPFAPLELLTRRLAGAAHVVGIAEECVGLLRRRVGRELSVFDGGIRMYRPGFRFDDADPYDHPLWFATPGSPIGSGEPIIARVLASGVAKGTTDYPRFEAVRQAASEKSISARRPDTGDLELARLFEAENASLREQLEALRDEQNQWLADAEVVRTSTEHQIAELRAEVFNHREQNKMLRSAVRDGSGQLQRAPLTDFADFGTWAATNLSPRIWFSPKAIKAAERSGQYRDPTEISDALFALDDTYIAMRLQPNEDVHRTWRELMAAQGLTLTPCFTRDGDLQRFPEYSVLYRGERRWCDLHLKRGNGADPKTMFRIYFHWHDDEGVLLVGHLPSHLDNNMTN